MASLHRKIQKELEAIGESVSQTESYLSKLDSTTDEAIQNALVSAIALNLHAFYTGSEHIFEMIAKVVDGSQPTGIGWHRQLMQQMLTSVEGSREAVISTSVFPRLDEFRRFRHVVRSNYSHLLERDRVIQLAEQLCTCHDDLKKELEDWMNHQPDIDQDASQKHGRGR